MTVDIVTLNVTDTPPARPEIWQDTIQYLGWNPLFDTALFDQLVRDPFFSVSRLPKRFVELETPALAPIVVEAQVVELQPARALLFPVQPLALEAREGSAAPSH